MSTERDTPDYDELMSAIQWAATDATPMRVAEWLAHTADQAVMLKRLQYLAKILPGLLRSSSSLEGRTEPAPAGFLTPDEAECGTVPMPDSKHFRKFRAQVCTGGLLIDGNHLVAGKDRYALIALCLMSIAGDVTPSSGTPENSHD